MIVRIFKKKHRVGHILISYVFIFYLVGILTMTGSWYRGAFSPRIVWVKGNPQAEHFWKKNGFVETGATNETDKYTVVVARRGLQ